MSEVEEWRPVVGWEEFYEVSDLGRVRSTPRTIVRPNDGATYRVGRVLATQVENGASCITLGSNQGRSGRANRYRLAYLVAEAFTDWNLGDMAVEYLNGDRTDARLSNLVAAPVTADGERWRPCPEFEGGYEVSDMGRVRSVARAIRCRVRGKMIERTVRPRILKPGLNGSGYPSVNLRREGVAFTRTIHRVVCPAFHGPRPSGQVIRHLDGNPLNNQADNLAYGTRQQNEEDKYIHAFAKMAGISIAEALKLANRVPG